MKFYSLFILIFVVLACNPQTKEETDSNDSVKQESTASRNLRDFEYSFLFGEIHDRAVVYVNNEKVFEGSTNGKEESLRFGLDDYLESGKNVVKVELYNDQTVVGKDTSWEIYYELFNENEPIDFMHEETTSGDLGLVFEAFHEIEI